jgi:hypothetical protein
MVHYLCIFIYEAVDILADPANVFIRIIFGLCLFLVSLYIMITADEFNSRAMKIVSVLSRHLLFCM